MVNSIMFVWFWKQSIAIRYIWNQDNNQPPNHLCKDTKHIRLSGWLKETKLKCNNVIFINYHGLNQQFMLMPFNVQLQQKHA